MTINKLLIKSSFLLIFVSLISCSGSDCSNDKERYQDGYSTGKSLSSVGVSGGCETYVNSINRVSGYNKLKATTCYCQGFYDGRTRKSPKH
jgi:hypothetical protein